MKNAIVLVTAAFLCLIAFPTTTVGKYWPNPSEISKNEMMDLSTAHNFVYGDSKVWRCTYSNGPGPAISISPSTPFPSTPSTPSPSTPSKPPPSKPAPSTPSTPSHSPPQSSTPPHAPKISPSPENPLEHMESCMRNMGSVGMCQMQMTISYYTRMFRVSNNCCNLLVNMRNECDDVVWGFFTDPFFVPLVRNTCHVSF